MAFGGSSDSDVAIRIGADFLGVPAFKKADTAVDKLYKSAKRLTGAFGIAFSAAAIARYAASSVRAFAAEEKQIMALTSTVRNLGLAFTAPEINEYIENLERATGIVREELQPAFQKLLTQTGSISKSQKILSTAVEVSFSGLMSVSEAANILTQAYVGNNKGLKQLNIGLTTAELNSMSFEQVLQRVSDTYKGQFSSALNTTAVKMDKLKVASGNAKEIIGGAFADAFTNIIADGDLEKTTNFIERAAEKMASLIRAISSGKPAFDTFSKFTGAIAGTTTTANNAKIGTGGSYFTFKVQQAKLAAVEAKALANAKKLEDAKLAILRKQTNEKLKQAALDKANALIAKAKEKFDLEGIQLAAALTNEKLTIEERSRLEILKATWELEQAIAQGDDAKIKSATALLEKLLGQFSALAMQLAVIEDMVKLFTTMGVDRKLIDLLNLEDAVNLAHQLSALGQIALPSGFAKATMPIVSRAEADTALQSALNPNLSLAQRQLELDRERGLFQGNQSAITQSVAAQSAPTVNVTVNGAIDPEGTARTIVDVLSRSFGRGALPAELLIL